MASIGVLVDTASTLPIKNQALQSSWMRNLSYKKMNLQSPQMAPNWTFKNVDSQTANGKESRKLTSLINTLKEKLPSNDWYLIAGKKESQLKCQFFFILIFILFEKMMIPT